LSIARWVYVTGEPGLHHSFLFHSLFLSFHLPLPIPPPLYPPESLQKLQSSSSPLFQSPAPPSDPHEYLKRLPFFSSPHLLLFHRPLLLRMRVNHFLAPFPTYFRPSSAPMTRMKQASVLLATAHSHGIFPVPGRPCSSTPMVISIPTLRSCWRGSSCCLACLSAAM
ncbi:hypothetical protein PFISCL1PPCAC_7674, partial [Pristionchus fissidentatus]